MLGNSANNEIHDVVPTVSTHDDQVRPKLFSNLHDDMFWFAST